MDPTEKEGVFKIRHKKIKQMHGVKVGDEFQRNGTTWQCFQPCNLEAVITEQRHYFCCVHCGFYIRGVEPKRNVKGMDKLKWNEHPNLCHGDSMRSEDSLADFSTSSSEALPDNEAMIVPFVLNLLVSLICFSKMSLVMGSSKYLSKLVHACILLGRKFSAISVDRIFPEWSRSTLSRKINEIGEMRARKNLEKFQNGKICIIWDAGKGLGLSLFFICYA
jgi:hypothetical protein